MKDNRNVVGKKGNVHSLLMSGHMKWKWISLVIIPGSKFVWVCFVKVCNNLGCVT